MIVLCTYLKSLFLSQFVSIVQSRECGSPDLEIALSKSFVLCSFDHTEKFHTAEDKLYHFCLSQRASFDRISA